MKVQKGSGCFSACTTFFYPQMYEKETGKQNWIAGNGREGKKT